MIELAMRMWGLLIVAFVLVLSGCGSRCGGAGETPSSHNTERYSNSSSLRFAVIGDYGSDGQGERMVADLVRSWSPDLVITLGDNNYPNGSAQTIDDNIGKYYGEFIYPYYGVYTGGKDMNRFFPAPGNHDWNIRAYTSYFTLPGNERYYDFIWGPVHFIALSTDVCEPDGVRQSSLQAWWLRERLQRSGSVFKVVYGHHPAYSSGSHGSVEYMNWPFDAWGADVYMAGHDHTYERLEIGNVLYYVNGLGGKSKYGFRTALPGSKARYNREYGAMRVDVLGNTATFGFYNIYNSLVDSTTISR